MYVVNSEGDLKAYLENLKIEDSAGATEVMSDCHSGYYAGCNYHINQGENAWEPKGSATSMHSCDNCEDTGTCKLKKTSLVWYLATNVVAPRKGV